ncbi:DUF2304 domain-containing protein [Brachybacterium muris]|uniref:DUF2304 domain-containing protein n=1 Tax=Brachybacterium muris TaxID=219301 RepID=UPI00223B1087|nr:DUF2304 domain-containing protein [Brachybacterium muris]
MDNLLQALGPTVGVSGRTFIIQLLLMAGIAVIVAWLFIKRGAKQLAVRRLLVIAFAVFAVLTVLFPTVLTRVANLVGVGRGADLLLYTTVLVLLGFLALQEARTKSAEKRTTYLARRLAIDEAEPAVQYRERSLSAHRPAVQGPERSLDVHRDLPHHPERTPDEQYG